MHGHRHLRDRMGRLVYEGGFENNQYSGQGVQYWPSGNKRYEGGFAENRYSGEGILYAQDGQTVLYAGAFKNGLRDGMGKATTRRGTLVYEGEFAEDAYHGSGTEYYDSGIVAYTGQFFEGEPQGQGTLYSARAARCTRGPSMRARSTTARSSARRWPIWRPRSPRRRASTTPTAPACSCTRRRASS